MGFKDLGGEPKCNGQSRVSTEARSHHLRSLLGNNKRRWGGEMRIRGSRHLPRLPVVSHTRLYLRIMLSVLLWGLNTEGRVKFCIILPREEAA